MSRMRTLKPDAATSESLAQVPREIRWTFAMLWTYLDDEGRGLRNARLIKAAIYPLDDDVTPDQISGELVALQGIGALCFYEIDGREYVHVPAWHEHQHPNRKVDSKLPGCPKNDHSLSAQVQRSEPTVSTPPQSSPVVVVVVGDGDGVVDGGVEARPDATTAQTIVAEWIERSPKRPPSQVVGQVAKLVGQMLAEAIDPDDIRRGLSSWMNKGLHPSTLPSVVNEVMNAPPLRARPSTRRSTDDKVRDGLALAARLAQEPSEPRQIGARQ